jgi:MFS transporter, DHA3 family, macrolide efflux protein
MRAFYTVLSGQLLSALATATSTCALNWWIYQSSGSVSRYALAFFFTALPGLLLAPLAGVLADRYPRRNVLLASTVLSALVAAAVLSLLAAGQLSPAWIYGCMCLQSCCLALQLPAFQALARQLTPPERLGRSAGLLQLAEGCSQTLAPGAAGLLTSAFGLQAPLLLALGAGGVALATLALARVPAAPRAAPGDGGLWQACVFALRYLRHRAGLMRLLAYAAGMNFVLGMVLVLSTPLLLSFTSARRMGLVLSAGSSGLLCASLLVSAGVIRVRGIASLQRYSVVAALCVAMAGWLPSVWWFGAIAYCFFFTVGLINATSMHFWLAQIPQQVQGRVFSARRMVSLSMLPLAYLAAGPLGHAFQDALLPGAPLAGLLGPVFGTGPGRGLALLLVLCGAALLVFAPACLRHPALAAPPTCCSIDVETEPLMKKTASPPVRPLFVRLLPTLVTLALLALMIWHGTIPERSNPHDYADLRAFAGIPNFGDVVSCAGFLLVSMYGALYLGPLRRAGAGAAVWNSYAIFLASLAFTAIGAGYYHAVPNDTTLLYSRLPNVLMLVGLMAVVRAETFGARDDNSFLAAGMAAAAGSFVWYSYTKASGNADVGPIYLVQVLCLVLVPLWQWIYKAPRADKGAVFCALLMFVLSQVVGGRDMQILQATGWISGHTIFHLFGAAAAAPIVWNMRRRLAQAQAGAQPGELRMAA